MEPVGAGLTPTATVGSVADEEHDPTEDEPEAFDPGEIRNELPEDLDVAGFVGPYVFPNNNRRRVPGYLYLLLGVGCMVLWFLTRGEQPVLVNFGVLAGGVALALIGVYHQIAGWNLDVDERDALVRAGETVGHSVGHASAQLGWRGLLSRPTWRILLYSAENPPQKRSLVLVDGVDGEVVAWFSEPNPEDWSDLDGALGSHDRGGPAADG